MPKNIKTWSSCVEQKDISAFTPIVDFGGNLISATIVAALWGLITGAIPAAALTLFFEGVLLKTLGLGCVGGTWLIGALIYVFFALIQWFNNMRTICMENAACAVGTIVHHPHSNTNGDLDLDLALAPFSPSEQQDAIQSTIKSLHGQSPAGSIMRYIFLAGSLSPKDRLDLYKHVVEDQFLKSSPDRLYQQKYFVSTPFLDSFVKNDKIKLPLYRCPSDSEDPSEKLPIPSPITDAELQNTFVYLPCVIEGHVIVEWLKNILVGLFGGLAGFIIGCAICMYFTGQEYFCAAVGAIVAAFLAFLAWLAAHFFNDPNDSKADGSSGVETDKSAPGTPLTTSAERDDVIVAFGSWVTYRLDNQYYEMHPVQAWYLVCRGDSLFEKGTISPEACRFDTARLKVDDYERICRMVHVAETVAPDNTTTRSFNGGLAMAGGLR